MTSFPLATIFLKGHELICGVIAADPLIGQVHVAVNIRHSQVMPKSVVLCNIMDY